MNERIARYLLNYISTKKAVKKNTVKDKPLALNKYTDEQIILLVKDLLNKLRKVSNPAFTNYKTYSTLIGGLSNARELKKGLIESNDVDDKYILVILEQFCYIAIALLTCLKKQHAKNIYSSRISPYNFTYNHKSKKAKIENLLHNLADGHEIKIEKQKHGNLKSFVINLYDLKYSKYLAPELKQNMLIYAILKKINNFFIEAQKRGLTLPEQSYIETAVKVLNRHYTRYSNKAEVYSVGYVLNELLSHLLEKIARINMTINEFPTHAVQPEFIIEADKLLPSKFNNHAREKAIALLNKAVKNVYALMKDKITERDSLKASIEKFEELLEQIKSTVPGTILEREEEEEEEHEINEGEEIEEEEIEEEEIEEEEIEEEEAEEEEAEEEEAEEEEAEEEEEEAEEEEAEEEEEEAEEEEAEEEEAEEEEAEEEEAEEEEEEAEEEEAEEEEAEEEEAEEEEAEEEEAEEEEAEEEEEEAEEEEAEEEEAEEEEAEEEEKEAEEKEAEEEEAEEEEEHEKHEDHENHGAEDGGEDPDSHHPGMH